MKAVSLRRRVILLSIGAMVVLIGVMLIATTLIVSHRLENDLLDRLDSRETLARSIPIGTSLETVVESLTDDQITATARRDGNTAVGASGRPRDRGPGFGPEDFEDHDRGMDPGMDRGMDRGHDIAAIRTVTLEDRTVITLIASSEENQRIIGRLVGAALLVAVAAIAAIAATIGLLARRTLAPLDHMVEVAERISSGDRGTRVHPDRDTTDLGRLASSFDRMVDSLEAEVHRSERSEATMRQFLADASHELRNPAAAIGATAERLIHGQLDQEERELLAVDVVRESRRLGQLVADLLDVARLEDPAASAEAEPIGISGLVADEVARTRRTLDHIGGPDVVTIEATSSIAPETPVFVAGQRDALGRVLANLLDNAVRHAPPQSTISVSQEMADDAVVVTVTNDGPPIPPDDRERIFERFTRLDAARARSEGGSGLGLAISRAIARAHQGDVHCVEPPAGRGASFELRLPVPDWQHGRHDT